MSIRKSTASLLGRFWEWRDGLVLASLIASLVVWLPAAADSDNPADRPLAHAGKPGKPAGAPQPEARAFVDTLTASIDDAGSPGESAGAVRIRVVRPDGAAEGLPVAIQIHGGRWTSGIVDVRDPDRDSDRETVVVFVDFEHATQSRQPLAIDISIRSQPDGVAPRSDRVRAIQVNSMPEPRVVPGRQATWLR